ALNISIEDRITQVTVNLERWRWLLQDLGSQYIIVNIADQRLQAFREGRPVLDSAIIVGREQRRTPVFSGKLTYLVFRPFWEVPPTLAVQDKLPELRKNPQRIVDLGFQVFRGWGEGEQEVNPLTVDWNRVSAVSFPYRLRQKPGPQNAMGNVKFMFPNKHNVYLHDTSARELFNRTNRTFSSGCIRVQRPAELAAIVLSDQPQWTREAIQEAMNADRDQTVRLKTPWSVHLEYWTAWVDPDGVVQFRSDVYGRDARVTASLAQPPPTSP
ncbi:peptidoglycan-binding protein, partial [bacterium CG17_big_fil_post_rev_8_21_14_2_50_64_8]